MTQYVVDLASAQSKGGGRAPKVLIILEDCEVRTDADGDPYSTVVNAIEFMVGGQFKIRRVRREGKGGRESR